MNRNNLRDTGLYLVLAIFIGAASAFVANLFVQGAVLFSTLRELSLPVFTALTLNHIGWYQGVALGFAALVIMYIRHAFGVTAWSGPAESMYALQYRAGPALDAKIGTGSVLAAFVACGCGAPVGQYGPVIHLGATLSQGLRNLIRQPLRPDIMLACGISGAITGAFNAPLAGMVFAFEVMLRKHQMLVIISVTAAAITAYLLNLWVFQHEVFCP